MTTLIRPAIPPAVRSPHPIVFLFLVVPFGAMSGYLTVSLAYLLSQAGVGVEAVGALIATSFLLHTWKFLWAPIVDLTFTRKRWYLATALASGLGIAAMGAMPLNSKALPTLTAIVLFANLAVTFLSMAVESLMACTVVDDQKGRVSGWFQAGNLGGSGLGGGAGLWMAQALPQPWVAGVVLGVVCMLCSAALAFIDEPPRPARREQRYVQAVVDVLRDCWRVVRTPGGHLALLVCFLPIGTGAASSLWSAIAGDWQASARTVALATGTFSGIVAAIGCVVGGWFCDRVDRKTAYCVYGLIQGACAVAMAFAPRTENTYIVFTLAYSFIAGLTYAAFTAVTLEAIGGGAAATKYSLFASLSNMPIAYMIVVDSWAQARWGSAAMLEVEAAVALAAVVGFVTVVAYQRLSAVAPARVERG